MADKTMVEESINKWLVNVDGELFTKLGFDKQLGRVVVATKTLEVVGHAVIQENPLVVWPSSSWRAYLESFLKADEDTKKIMLDMYTPPVKSALMQDAKRTALTLRPSSLPTETITKLVGVANTNAHEYYGTENNPFAEIQSYSSRLHSGKSALFAYGSKVPHSCFPNVTYTSKTKEGYLTYKLIRPIQEGDLVAFAYLDRLFATPTHERRRQLVDSKEFFCQCRRCIGPDYCRLHRCPDCQCFLVCTVVNQDDPPVWNCIACGEKNGVDDLLSEKERALKSRIRVVHLLCNSLGGVTNVHPGDVYEMVKAVTVQVPNRHFLALEAFEIQARILASHAMGIEQAEDMGMLPRGTSTPFGKAETLRLQATEAAVAFVAGCECNAAECTDPLCQGGHSPIYECTKEVFHASQDLKKVRQALWPNAAANMVRRYIPMMKVSYGNQDEDVLELESLFLNDVTIQSTSTGSSVSVSKPSGHNKKGSNRPPNKKKNKKKGRK